MFCFMDAYDKTTWPLNRWGITDLLSLKILFTIRQKSWEPRFWEMIDFLVCSAYECLVDSKTLLQRLLTCVNSTLDLSGVHFW